MALRVGINGFGRIGRLVLRAGLDEPDLEFIAVNDIADPETLAYLLQFDSIHGLLDEDVVPLGSGFSVDGQDITVLRERDPAALPWKEMGVDLVIEASGKFSKGDAMRAHLEAGAKYVLITAPAEGVDGTFVVGVNDDQLDPAKHKIISSASCTTNTLAVVAKVLHDAFTIERGFMTTVHSYTNSQVLLDKPANKLRRSRAAALNLIPTTTGAAKTIEKVMPELSGKLDAMAIRSPNPAGSIVDLSVLLGRDVTADEVNNVFSEASETERLMDVLLISDDPLVSTDIVGTSFTAIVDAESTMANKNMAKVLAWYDNEWGYSCRVVDLAAHYAS
ncbi:MAG TPA: type I glyceraldehyde-3-phosphate dehydrogenase [Armatimonadota bacterium]|nr:type I glyceraldehyde-3-phosphate dehydrogenase [Armatimonadota bacterium]